MKKRVLSAILAMLMVVTLFAGCNGGGAGNKSDLDMSALEGLEYPLASKEPLELSLHYAKFVGDYIDVDGEQVATVYQAAKEKTNISLKNTVGKDQDAAQAFNLMLLEERIPDIVYSTMPNINAAGYSEGVLVDLKPYVTDPEIMPNLSKIYEENPEYLAAVTAPDGAVYGCFKLREPGPTQAWYTREDWLEKLGLEHPKTYEEFVNVMDAFRNQDPNGNGKKDEVPYMGDVRHLFYFFGLNGHRYWDIDKNNKMIMPYVTENYKLALKTINEWYEKGYIDQETFTRSNPRGELWGSNTGGMTFNWFSSTMSYNDQIKNVPGFHVSIMMPPKNIHGDAYCHSPGDIVETGGWGVSIHNEHLAETLRYIDFWYSEEGSLLKGMGLEGRDWVLNENGEPEYTAFAKDYEGGAVGFQKAIGGAQASYRQRQVWLLAGMSDEARAGNKAYIDADFTSQLVPNYVFTEEEQAIIDKKWVACETYIYEYLQKAIMGTIDVDATWDEYVDELDKMGLEDCVKVHNSAYKRYCDLLKDLSK